MTSPAIQVFPNAVDSLDQAPTLILLIPDDAKDWCNQYAQEGYNVIQVPYPSPSLDELQNNLEAAQQHLMKEDNPVDFAVITFGLADDHIPGIVLLANVYQDHLRALVHYSPLAVDGSRLVMKKHSGEYIPLMVHLASAQEKLHASLLPFADLKNLPYNLPVSSYSPATVHTYPLVPISPPFPLLTKAPVAVNAIEKLSEDVYVRSATGLAYTKTLELLRRELGPHFELEKLWERHTYYEFVERDSSKTIATMVDTPYVNHIATMTGGVGHDDLARFYKYHFTGTNVTPPDTEIIPISRTTGADRIVDEMIFRCTHTTEIDYFLPGIKPTGLPLEIALVGVVAFRGDKLTFEHIYWDQASVLVQLGLLDPKGLPVAGKEVAQKVIDPFGLPSNTLMARWKESEGLNID